MKEISYVVYAQELMCALMAQKSSVVRMCNVMLRDHHISCIVLKGLRDASDNIVR